MDANEANRHAVAALKEAQTLSGARSANEFARKLAEHAGGSPAESTYRRWLTGGAAVPAWALAVAAEVAGTSLAELLTNDTTDFDNWRVQVDETLARHDAEIAELRGLGDLAT
jgi:hypothetical protein